MKIRQSMNRMPLAICTVFLLVTSLGFGQSSNTDKIHQLNPLPEFASWIERFMYPQEIGSDGKVDAKLVAKLDPDLPRKITTTKTGAIIHEVVESVSGGQTDKWQVGQMFYLKPPGQTYWGEYDAAFQLNNPPSQVQFMLIPKEGIRGAAWIQESNFAGFSEKDGKSYWYFTPGPPEDRDAFKPEQLNRAVDLAILDKSTGLPVLIRQSGVSRVFNFSNPPSAMQALPADLIREIQRGKELRAKVFAVPKKKY